MSTNARRYPRIVNLYSSLYSNDEIIPEDVVMAFEESNDRRELEYLREMLKEVLSDNRNPSAREKALKVLYKLTFIGIFKPLTVMPLLYYALADNNSAVSRVAVLAIGRIGRSDPDTMKHLGETLLYYRESSVREEAAKVLGEMGDGRAIEYLYNAFKDTDQTVVKEAIKALVKINHPKAMLHLIKGLTSKDEFVSKATAFVLRRIEQDDPARFEANTKQIDDRILIISLRKVLATGTDGTVCCASALVLGYLRDESVLPELLQALQKKDDDIRGEAIAALGRMKHADAISPLLTLFIRDSNTVLRKKAVSALRSIRDIYGELSLLRRSAVVADLCKVLQTDTDDEIRGYSAVILGYIKDPDAIRFLLSALDDHNASVSKAAGLALGRIGSASESSLIDVLINWQKVSARCAAATGLGIIRSDAAIDALAKVLQNAPPRVQRSAWEELKEINTPRTRSILAQQSFWKKLFW